MTFGPQCLGGNSTGQFPEASSESDGSRVSQYDYQNRYRVDPGSTVGPAGNAWGLGASSTNSLLLASGWGEIDTKEWPTLSRTPCGPGERYCASYRR